MIKESIFKIWKFFKTFQEKIVIVKDFLLFLWERKLWWLIPTVVILLLIGIILVLTQGSAIAPFIYTLF